MKHVHCELIKAWADNTSLEIEVWAHSKNKWETIDSRYVSWRKDSQYRIKPEEPNYGYIAYKAYGLKYEYAPLVAPYWNAAAEAVIEAYKKHHGLS